MGRTLKADSDGIFEAIAGATVALVSDALDRIGVHDRVLDPSLRPLTAGTRLVGRAVPVVVEATAVVPEEPYALQMRVLDSLGPGDVPLFCVDPTTRAALWGELFACAAIGRGSPGAIVDGFVRDTRQLRELDYPVFARGHSPLDTLGRTEVTAYAVSAICGGVRVDPADLVVADDDGVVIVPGSVLDEVVAFVDRKARDELGARSDLIAGASIFEVWEKWRVL